MPQGQKPAPLRQSKLQACSARALSGLRPLLAQLRSTNAPLAEQLSRAFTHVATELAHAKGSPLRAKRQHLLASLAATSEALTLLRLVVDSHGCGWESAQPGYLELSRLHEALLRGLAPKLRRSSGRGRAARARARRDVDDSYLHEP